VVAEKVTYGTEFGMRVPAVVYRPEHAGKRMPALVVVNGHGGDKYSWYSFYTGLLYARAGGVVLTYDPIGEGERSSSRRSGTRDHDRIVDVQGYPQHLAGLMITDVMQAVSYLRTRADVDPERIAIAGYSMGSFVSALTGAYDTRIHAVVLSGGGDLDGPGGYWDSSTKYMCQAIPWQSLKVLGDRPAVIYALNQQRGPTLIINGTADSLVDIPHHLEPYFAELRTRVERLTGTKKNIFDTYFIPDVSHRPNWVTRPGAEWMQRTLGFPGWTMAGVEKMPETHISAWAKENNVDMDKGYIQEDREGGVMALGTGFPNVTRAQLTVVPVEEWQRDRDRYVYEAWVRQTLATIEPKLPLNLPQSHKEKH
jgi:dienelactone hydrolase